MNQTTEQLQKRLENLVDRYEMRKTGTVAGATPNKYF